MLYVLLLTYARANIKHLQNPANHKLSASPDTNSSIRHSATGPSNAFLAFVHLSRRTAHRKDIEIIPRVGDGSTKGVRFGAFEPVEIQGSSLADGAAVRASDAGRQNRRRRRRRRRRQETRRRWRIRHRSRHGAEAPPVRNRTSTGLQAVLLNSCLVCLFILATNRQLRLNFR